MLEALKKFGTDLTLGVKDLFASPESQVYVKDLRKVMTYKDGQKCRYPENYDHIVESGKIIENKDVHGNPVLDKDKKPTYRLVYGDQNKEGRPFFELTKVTEVDDRSYFTIKFLVDKGRVDKNRRDDNDDYSRFYKPFKFSKIDLEKHLPVFEAEKTENSQYPFKLTHSSVLTKKEKNKEGKIQEVVDEKGRNGELLYTSDYKKLNISFFEVRDQNGNLELDKSLISVPIVFATSLAKVCAKLLTFAPIKLGEYFIGKQNPIVKSLGYLLFTPAMAVKNSVSMVATILKAPILLFVANKEKYGDAYWTMWKYQLEGCWEEAKGDFNVIKDGKRAELEKKDSPEHKIGTWKELDAMKRDTEEGSGKKLDESSERASEYTKQSLGEDKLQDEQMADRSQKNSTPHTDKVTRGRQRGTENAPSRS
ncbi:hypothetical protein [Candidatus Wolbachia massiliensis]|uniref:Uncharacterized protein n=1 Tax=Candidatus Wolbachia massiliensis TaxID=1845000 RepID=A0A7M3U2R6_9RICK|nr:hypothetical protein [Candidatus Wolbachia massiliensis]QOD38701.1 hypothetical protein ID128_02470 [Candidatus Wolbachia massiliensis]